MDVYNVLVTSLPHSNKTKNRTTPLMSMQILSGLTPKSIIAVFAFTFTISDCSNKSSTFFLIWH